MKEYIGTAIAIVSFLGAFGYSMYYHATGHAHQDASVEKHIHPHEK